MSEVCAACGKASDSLKTCISCKLVKYCNRECQISHWPKHKKLCKQLAAELARNDNKPDSNTKTNTEGIGSINVSDNDIAADKKKSTTYDEQNQLLMDAGLSDLIDIDKDDLSGLINSIAENMRENIGRLTYPMMNCFRILHQGKNVQFVWSQCPSTPVYAM